MKLLTSAVAVTALLALGACNRQEAANASGDNTATANAVDANAAAPAGNATETAAKPADNAAAPASAGGETATGDKPADSATPAGAEATPPAGDKPPQ